MAHELPPRIAEALAADDSGPLDQVIRARDPADFEVLRRVARGDGVEPEAQRKALYALGRWGDPRVLAEIEDVLPGLDIPSRMAAIDALGRLGTDRAVEAVVRYADDDSPQVRKFVVKSLSRIASADARTTLRRMAAAEQEERWLRDLAQESLDAMGA
jgi:HEAT repeat protein